MGSLEVAQIDVDLNHGHAMGEGNRHHFSKKHLARVHQAQEDDGITFRNVTDAFLNMAETAQNSYSPANTRLIRRKPTLQAPQNPTNIEETLQTVEGQNSLSPGHHAI